MLFSLAGTFSKKESEKVLTGSGSHNNGAGMTQMVSCVESNGKKMAQMDASSKKMY